MNGAESGLSGYLWFLVTFGMVVFLASCWHMALLVRDAALERNKQWPLS